MASNVPNSWFVFVNAKNGIVKFGALDQNNTTPIKFSTIEINTSNLVGILDCVDSEGRLRADVSGRKPDLYVADVGGGGSVVVSVDQRRHGSDC